MGILQRRNRLRPELLRKKAQYMEINGAPNQMQDEKVAAVLPEKALYVTRRIMDEFIRENQSVTQAKRASQTAAWVWIWLWNWIPLYVPVSWQAVTKGSFDELFLYFANHHVWDGEAWIPAITLDLLRECYQNPVRVLERRQRGELPKKRPQ